MSLPHLRDVSSYQHPVDWRVEAREVEAVYVKVSQGLTYTNPYGQTQLRNARAAKLPAGGYHYCTPGVGSGQQQADRLLSLTPLTPGRLRPCLDCEAPSSLTPPQLAAWYLAAVVRVLARTGLYPTIYGSPYYLAGFAQYHPEVFGRCPLLVADYGVTAPKVPPPWTGWAAWQWTDANRDPAVTTLTDDSFVADLGALTIPRPTVRRLVTKHKAQKAYPHPDSMPQAA